ncbi:hypothetical protein EYZ11_010947 [Aspergillus tanneri]|uniref:Uncharacterized protein n=1 Tax=Aspergillus tanneri TaxID=1220188 RepID=A0A4S3J4E7_9EURO|nr:hypothetical protein EYZ11_010947 [Aspergillus tanneri]
MAVVTFIHTSVHKCILFPETVFLLLYDGLIQQGLHAV